ncbi:hypothetical protein BKA70DRAFT_1093916 [Coprinopsis sp. MPI-PUGE-AT-0042]|nr:hypothetical protein BKA70DRAFT_1093916 [Coprinopsis sp. MPI-PUGE-AT-0042]
MYGQPQAAYGSAHAFPQQSSFYANQYQQQQQHQYSHIPQPPPAQYHHFDPAAFRKHYMDQLAGLTFNSRAIIENLVMLAQNNSRSADIIVSCIDAHIRKVPPQHKLPAFYLIDAISKNVFEPYAKRFASVVTPLFLQTYNQSDDQTRNKMEEMLLTWRDGSPHRREVFGPVTQLAIERGVWGDGKVASVSVPGTRLLVPVKRGRKKITRGQVLSELQYAIGRRERELQTNPYDQEARTKLEVMQQLRRLVTAGVSPEELLQIAAQLREQDKPSSHPPPPPQNWQQPPQQYPPRPSSSAPQYPAFPPAQYNAPPPQPQPVPSTSAVPASADAANIARILDSLKNSGVLSLATVTPPPSQELLPKAETKPQPIADDAASRAYRDSILAEPSILSSTEILRGRPSVATFVYDRLPAQCKQCGVRYPDSEHGKKAMHQHLDDHFAQNRKANQETGRGHSRAWFVSVEDWISGSSGNDKGKGRADPNSTSNATMPSLSELRAQFVVVPPGDEAKNISCPICKENMKSEFMEDDEEWVWRNAVLKDDKIYHATCHAEAMVSTSGIAARLRNDIVGGSRGGTPDSRSTPPPSSIKKEDVVSPESKVGGLKRKVDSDSADESIRTPPMKKVALST